MPPAIFEARRNARDVDQQRRKFAAPPFVAADRERAQRVAVIALAACNEHAPIGLADFDEILARKLQRRFHRFRAARHQIHVIEPVWRIGGECVGERFGGIGREKARVCVGDAIDLRVHRLQHVRVRVSEARHGSAAARIDIAPAVAIDDLDAARAHRRGRHGT